jgi:hypothetical protein
VTATGAADVLTEDEDRAGESAGLTAAKKSIGAFESALATAEDDTDRQATSIARAEEDLDAADFSEQPEEEQQFQAVLAELSGAERYALRQMEEQEQDWARGQVQLAEAEIQARQEEFDVDKLDELTQVRIFKFFYFYFRHTLYRYDRRYPLHNSCDITQKVSFKYYRIQSEEVLPTENLLHPMIIRRMVRYLCQRKYLVFELVFCPHKPSRFQVRIHSM